MTNGEGEFRLAGTERMLAAFLGSHTLSLLRKIDRGHWWDLRKSKKAGIRRSRTDRLLICSRPFGLYLSTEFSAKAQLAAPPSFDTFG